MFQHILV